MADLHLRRSADRETGASSRAGSRGRRRRGVDLPVLHTATTRWFTDWYRDLPYWFAVTVSPERAALLIGYSLFLVNSANQVVVAVLTTAGSSVRHSVRSIRGGRIIGPIERLFILWMAVAGQALAIAVIVAAKGIVRYPEISEGSRSGKRRDRGALAEYVLIGSLVSWSLAFLMVPLY